MAGSLGVLPHWSPRNSWESERNTFGYPSWIGATVFPGSQRLRA